MTSDLNYAQSNSERISVVEGDSVVLGMSLQLLTLEKVVGVIFSAFFCLWLRPARQGLAVTMPVQPAPTSNLPHWPVTGSIYQPDQDIAPNVLPKHSKSYRWVNFVRYDPPCNCPWCSCTVSMNHDMCTMIACIFWHGWRIEHPEREPCQPILPELCVASLHRSWAQRIIQNQRTWRRMKDTWHGLGMLCSSMSEEEVSQGKHENSEACRHMLYCNFSCYFCCQLPALSQDFKGHFGSPGGCKAYSQFPLSVSLVKSQSIPTNAPSNHCRSSSPQWEEPLTRAAWWRGLIEQQFWSATCGVPSLNQPP